MWNGKCNPAKEPPLGMIQNNLNIRNGPANDTCSITSVSSEDISTSDLPTACCSSNATNPAKKGGRRFSLLQVSFHVHMDIQRRKNTEIIKNRHISHKTEISLNILRAYEEIRLSRQFFFFFPFRWMLWFLIKNNVFHIHRQYFDRHQFRHFSHKQSKVKEKSGIFSKFNDVSNAEN